MNFYYQRFALSADLLHVEHRYVSLHNVGTQTGNGFDYRLRFGVGVRL